MKTEFLPVASAELADAVGYYEAQMQGLGLRFQREIMASVRRILLSPTIYQPISPRSRRCLVRRSPYGIIFQHSESENQLLIVAVAHMHREPEYWLSRE